MRELFARIYNYNKKEKANNQQKILSYLKKKEEWKKILYHSQCNSRIFRIALCTLIAYCKYNKQIHKKSYEYCDPLTSNLNQWTKASILNKNLLEQRMWKGELYEPNCVLSLKIPKWDDTMLSSSSSTSHPSVLRKQQHSTLGEYGTQGSIRALRKIGRVSEHKTKWANGILATYSYFSHQSHSARDHSMVLEQLQLIMRENRVIENLMAM